MEIYKKISNYLLVIMVSLLFLVGCAEMGKQKEEFLIDTKGYPINNVININGDNLEFVYNYNLDINNKSQTLRYNSKIDDEIVIILAQGDVIFDWVLNPDVKGIDLISKERYLPNENKEYDLEGKSPYLEKFKFKITDKESFSEINFKKVNVDFIKKVDGSKYKDFLYSDVDYLMKLNIVFEK